MMTQTRRSLLASIGFALPFGLGSRVRASATSTEPAPLLGFRPFEEAVREAFRGHPRTSSCRVVEIGQSDEVRAGVQGCHNDGPFAGFPAGHLRIVRAGSAPGPVRRGVRLYVTTVDVVLTGGLTPGFASRPLDFSTLPPAPTFT